MLKDFTKILLLVNSEGKKKIINQALDFFNVNFNNDINNEKFIIKFTEDRYSTKSFSKAFSKEYDNSLIIALGGDGTTHEIINSINFDRTSLAILPNGTGNDFATHLYSTSDLTKILLKINNLRFEKVDVIRINHLYCMNTMSFGYDTVILEKSLKIKRRFLSLSKISFKLAIPLTLHKIKPVEYEFNLNHPDGTSSRGKGSYILSAICNGSRFGGGFTPAPKANIKDGISEINMIDNLPLLELLLSIPAYKNGSHVDKLKASHNYQAVSGLIKPTKGKIKGNIDGELYEFDQIEFEVIPKALNLMVL